MRSTNLEPPPAIPISDTGRQKTDADELCRLLDLTLANKRLAWQRAQAQRQFVRAASFVFLFLVIAGALAAFCFVAFRATDLRSGQNQPIAIPNK
jgi:hypothetical protein